jgi:PAS domain S-box-containing protein
MLVEHSQEAILLTRKDGQVVSANPAACRMFGRTEEELISIGRDGVTDAADPRLAAAIAERERTGRFRGELTAIRADGSRFPVELASSVFTDSAGEQWTSLSIRDISRRKAAEGELHHAREVLEVALAAASLGAYDVDRALGRASVDARYLEMLGYAPGEVDVTWEQVRRWVHPDDLPRVDRTLAAFEHNETDLIDVEYRLHHRDGRWVWVRDRGRVLSRDDAGRPVHIVGTHVDVTHRREAEAALREALEWQQRIFEGSRDAIFLSDAEARFIAVNAAAERLTGYSRGELLAMRIPDLHEEVDLGAFRTFHARILAGESVLSEAPVRRKDGGKAEVEFSNSAIDVGGRTYMHTIARDLTERRRAEATLLATQERYQRLFSTMNEGFAVHEIVCDGTGRPVDYRFLDANDQFFVQTGLPRNAIGKTVREVLPEIEEFWLETYGRVALTGTPAQFQQFTAPLGKHFEVRAYSPAPGQFATVFFDVTDRKRAELEAERRLRQLTAVSHLGAQLTARFDTRALLETVVRAVQQSFDYFNVALLLHDPVRQELGEQAMVGPLAAVAEPGYRLPVGAGLIGAAARDGATALVNDVTKDSRYIEGFPEARLTRSEIVVPVMLGGEVLAVLDVQETRTDAFDDTDVLTLETLARVVAGALDNARLLGDAQRQLAERTRAEEDYRQLFEAESDAILLIDNETGRILAANSAAASMYGYTQEELLEMRNTDLSAEPEQTRQVTRESPVDVTGVVLVPSRQHRRRDGTVFPVEITGRFFHRDGRPVHIAAIRDVTERHRAEEALRLSEEQLRHAQKMEAVGRLAGGVAHDFNNLLQALLSYTTVLKSAASDPERLAAITDEIVQRIHRGAALTRQLLLFSRRSASRPESIDLNVVVRATEGFLRHLLRENIGFVLETAPTPVRVTLDPGLLDQVVMNLAVNAADAMPGGGRLTIRVVDRDSGWAEVAVEDTGHGIDPAMREKIFEPFFTTKEAGHGTGLGLSVVHGIVTEHGGRIEVESSIGAGTTFRILLPRTSSGEHPAAPGPPPDEVDMLNGKGERVLVVEDEEAAREGLREILEVLGYDVTVAGSAEEAATLGLEAGFEVLLTDLLLPGASGVELAQALTERWPALRVVLMSGYAEDERTRRAIADRTVRYLQKPFDMTTLAREIRASLARGTD